MHQQAYPAYGVQVAAPAASAGWPRHSAGPQPRLAAPQPPFKSPKRPVLSSHGFYMCLAVSILVAIGLVIAVGFFMMQRQFAETVVRK